jgi:biotin operon repressor
MSSRDQILSQLKSQSPLSGKELTLHLGISRQALNVHLQDLISTGQIVKTGSTRNARYYARSNAPATENYSKNVILKNLDESVTYDQVATTLNLRSALRSNIESIIHYAFTEMLNNAIDHAKSDRGHVTLGLEAGSVIFEIRDYGIGLFQSIASKFNLEDESAAMIELIKGKTTTMPDAHSGEGIFFTSKIADQFILQSHRIQVEWNKHKDDTFVSEVRKLKGTHVKFTIRRDARTQLTDVFETYAPADFNYQFQKTKVHIKLLQSDYISRSEARRLLLNLDKFTEVILDFKGVKSIGQGFADETFRVFINRNPQIRIVPLNTNPVIDAMLRHVSKK